MQMEVSLQLKKCYNIIMAEEVNIFEDFDNSQEYFDYLKESSKPDPDRVAKEKAAYKAMPGKIGEAAVGFAKGAYWPAKDLADMASLPLSLFKQAQQLGLSNTVGAPIYDAVPELTEIIPFLSRFENKEEKEKILDTFIGIDATVPEAAGWVGGLVTGSVASFEGLTKIKEKYPDLYKKLRRAFPFSVGQLHQKYKATTGSKLKKMANVVASAIPKGWHKKDWKKANTPAKNIIKNWYKLAKIGTWPALLVSTEMGDATVYKEDGTIKDEFKQYMPKGSADNPKVVFPEDIFEVENPSDIEFREPWNDPSQMPLEWPTPKKLAYGGDPNEGGIFTDSMITGEEEDINVDDIIKQPGLENMSDFDIFEEAKKEGYEETEVALNLLGKVPMWAAANVDKAKMLLQIFTKNEIKNMDNVKNKLGTKEEVLEKIEDIDILDTPSGETVVGAIKNKKTIIDSPEDAESVFYSGLEARLMDPNTPKSFNTKEDLYNFLNQKGISKVEVEDNILNRYIDVAKKNGKPLLVDDMLEIVRQAPMRKVQSVVYGDASYGGTKGAKYGGGHYESGEIPGSYREEVLYLPAEDIPLDPNSLPMSGHDFSEKYVIGWSRLTDRKATLPVNKTQAGITGAIDEKQIKTIQKNQKKLASQIDGLYASAYEKLKRAGNIEDLPDIDNLTSREIKDKVNQFTFDIQELDEPLYKQIEQFENKLMTDNMKLTKFKEMKEGQKVTVTFADEVQSDILQQAKKMEENFMAKLADLMDKNKDVRSTTIAAGQRSYSRDKFQGLNPEVAEFFIENKSVFRPIFNTAQDMQQFLDEFTKTQKAISALGEAGLRPDPKIVQTAQAARKKQDELLESLKTSLSEESMKLLMPNVPFKNRAEWGSALLKMNINNAAKRLFVDKADDAAEWFAISPSELITKRYSQSGGTHTPLDQRTSDMKGIGMEEFYGGPGSLSTTIDKSGTAATNTNFGKPKHYTSTLEKELKRLAKENNSEFKIIKIDGVGDAFAIKLTPEMLLPHKTHRKKGGMVYTPELIDIFEAA